jgi:hypothetical protein
MSWGKKILILYLGFVALILTLVFTCFGHKTELEYKDYYVRELRFQDQINARQNAANLAEPIAHEVHGQALTLDIPLNLLGEDLSGEIELLRPSDASKDITERLSPGTDGRQTITITHKGAYKLRVRLRSAGTDYFHEGIVSIR